MLFKSNFFKKKKKKIIGKRKRQNKMFFRILFFSFMWSIIIWNSKKSRAYTPLRSPTKHHQKYNYKCRTREPNVQKPPSTFANTSPRMQRFVVAKLADSNPRDGEALGRLGRLAEAVALGFSRYAFCLHVDCLLHQSRFRFLRSPPRRRGEEPHEGPLWFADRSWS